MNYRLLTILITLILLNSCSEKIDESHVQITLSDSKLEEKIIEVNDKNEIYLYDGDFEYMGKKRALVIIKDSLKKLDNISPFNIYVTEKADQEKLVELLKILNDLDFGQLNIHTIKDRINTDTN